MLEEYVRLLGQLIPPVDPDVARKVIESVRRDRPTPKQLYAIPAPAGICQGDVIGPVTFKWVGDEGEWVEDRGLSLVLSNSCDAETDDYITVALCFEYREFVADAAISARTDFHFLRSASGSLRNAACRGTPAARIALSLAQKRGSVCQTG